MTIDNTRAAYRVLDPNGFYGPDDTLYMVSQDGIYPEIYFDGVPNEQMEPLNQLAEERLNKYLQELDDLARVSAEKLGRPYVGRPRNLDGALSLATEVARDSMRIMGANKSDNATIERMAPVQVPETGSINPRRKAGRPRTISAAA